MQSSIQAVNEPEDSNLYVENPLERPLSINTALKNATNRISSSFPSEEYNYLPTPQLITPSLPTPLTNNFETSTSNADQIQTPTLSSPFPIDGVSETLIFKHAKDLNMSFPLRPADGLGPSPIVRFSGIKRTIAEADSLYMCYQERTRSEVSRMFVKGVTLNGLTSYKIIVHFIFDKKSTYAEALRIWPEKTDTTFLFKDRFLGALPNVQFALPSVSKTRYFDQIFHAIIVVKDESTPFPPEREKAVLKILLQISQITSTQDYSKMLISGLKFILP